MAIQPARRPKKIVVIGAGPAGLEAARVLEAMGHSVILFEKTDQIGGQINLAALPPGKDEFKEVIRFYNRALSHGKVNLRLGLEADPDKILAEEPDEVIVATGSVPLEPDIPGINNPSVTTAHELLAGRTKAGRSAVVLGGGNIGLETANYLLSQGTRVTVIEMGQKVGQDLGPGRRYLLMRRLRELKLKRLVRCKIRRIHADRVSYVREEKNGERSHQELTGVETFVNALGVRPMDQLALDLEGIDRSVVLIGDALSPGKILDAVCEGARAAHYIESRV
jgi:2,4-dienoyl-CoA reductase (NADPH2)